MTTMLGDAATKHFVEIQPATEPSDASWYTNYINTRQFTLSNIVQLCKLSTEISQAGNISKLLQGEAFGQHFWFTSEDPVGKCILQIDFLFNVWVNHFSFICEDDSLEWFVKFKWQALNESNTWIDISGKVDTVKQAITSYMKQGGNKIEWMFSNPITFTGKRYKSWRVIGEGGGVVDGYINLILMNLQ